MDFRFDKDEVEVIEQAASTFKYWLPASRFTAEDGSNEGWTEVMKAGWLSLLDGSSSEWDVPLPLICGVGREAGRVLAGDAFVANNLLAALSNASLPPAFLLADGRTQELMSNSSGSFEGCFGVEPGLIPVKIDRDQCLFAGQVDAWTLKSEPELSIGIGTVSVGSMERLGRARNDVRGMVPVARILHSATLLGAGQQVLDEAVTHASQRRQFGVPIGAFQGVKHPMAEAAALLEVAWNSVLVAALDPSPLAAASAALQAKRAAELATRVSLQVFGGIGMTWEHPLHLYLKAARSARNRYSDNTADALRVAASFSDTYKEASV